MMLGYYLYLHFKVAEAEAEKLNNLPQATRPGSGRTGIWT